MVKSRKKFVQKKDKNNGDQNNFLSKNGAFLTLALFTAVLTILKCRKFVFIKTSETNLLKYFA